MKKVKRFFELLKCIRTKRNTKHFKYVPVVLGENLIWRGLVEGCEIIRIDTGMFAYVNMTYHDNGRHFERIFYKNL